MNRKTRIAFLTSRTPQSIYIINRLSSVGDVVGILYETPRSKAKPLPEIRKRIKCHGFFKLIDQILFRLWERIVLIPRDLEKINTHLPPEMTEEILEKKIPLNTFASLNKPEAVRRLSELKPDVVIVCGTSILKTPIIDVCREGIINLHTGIIPEYRGVYSAFWALYMANTDNIGVTIHRVSEKLDVGQVLFQERIHFDPSYDTINTLFAKQIVKGTELIIKALQDLASGGFKAATPRTDTGQENLYFHPGFTDYIRMKRRLKKL